MMLICRWRQRWPSCWNMTVQDMHTSVGGNNEQGMFLVSFTKNCILLCQSCTLSYTNVRWSHQKKKCVIMFTLPSCPGCHRLFSNCFLHHLPMLPGHSCPYTTTFSKLNNWIQSSNKKFDQLQKIKIATVTIHKGRRKCLSQNSEVLCSCWYIWIMSQDSFSFSK